MGQRIKVDLNYQETVYSKFMEMKELSSKTKAMLQTVAIQCTEVFSEGETAKVSQPTFSIMERKYNDLDLVVGVSMFYVLKTFNAFINQDKILAGKVLNDMLDDPNVSEEDKKYILDHQKEMVDKTEKSLRSRREAAEKGEVPPPEPEDEPGYEPIEQGEEVPETSSGNTTSGEIPQASEVAAKTKEGKISGQFKPVREGLFYNEETHQYAVMQENGQCIIVDESAMMQSENKGQVTFDSDQSIKNEGFKQLSDSVYYSEETGEYAIQQENGEYAYVHESEVSQTDNVIVGNIDERGPGTILGTPVAEKHMHKAAWNYQQALHSDITKSIDTLPSEFIEKSHTILPKITGQKPNVYNTTFESLVKKSDFAQTDGTKIVGQSVFKPQTGNALKAQTFVNTIKMGTISFENNKGNVKTGF